jgi:hypothetical protein
MSLFESASLVVTPNGTKASKLYAIKPTSGAGDLSVTRATTATRVNSAGLIESVANNVPRLDYTDSTCPSILVEPQRTNKVIYSKDISTQSLNWITNQGGITDDNFAISPDGTNTASLITPNGILPYSGVLQPITITGGTNTFSVYLKTVSGSTNIDLICIDGGFNISNKTINSTWTRYTFTFNAIGGDATIYISSAAATPFLAWGAQLELGSYATSYIPTVASAVTRNADVISKTGISSLIGQTEGTMFVEFNYNSINDSSTSRKIISLNDGSSTNLIDAYIQQGNTTLQARLRAGAVGFGAITTAALSSGNYKLAYAYKNSDFVLYINGTQVGSVSSGAISFTSPIGIVQIGDGEATGDELGGLIKATAIWKTRLTNAELSELTTL